MSLGWYLNLVSLSKVKCLVYCEICECTFSVIEWKNRVRTMTFGFAFCSVLYGVGFGSVWVLARFWLLGSVRFLAKPGFWFRSFLMSLCMCVSYITSYILYNYETARHIYKQETRLLLTNCATRLEILTFEKYCDLETGVMGHWRSLEMSPFDTARATSCWCSMACHDLEIRFWGHSSSLKVVPFDRLGMVSY